MANISENIKFYLKLANFYQFYHGLFVPLLGIEPKSRA